MLLGEIVGKYLLENGKVVWLSSAEIFLEQERLSRGELINTKSQK